MHRWLWLLLVASVLGGGWHRPAQAQTAVTGVTLAVQAGFDGRYRQREGWWLPVRVTLANAGPEVQGELLARPRNTFAMSPTEPQRRPVILPTQSRREFFIYLPVSANYFDSVAVELVAGGQVVVSDTVSVRPISTDDLLAGLLVNQAGPFGTLSSALPGRSVMLSTLTPADLPSTARAWQALDVLIVQDVDTSVLTAEQRQALTAWVNAGGRLWVMGGPAWQKTTAGLREVLPVSALGPDVTADISPLQARIGARLDSTQAIVALATLQPAAQALLYTANGQPLVCVIQRGFGEVLFFAADPTLAPLRSWGGLPQLYASWLSNTQSQPAWWRGPTDTSGLRDAARALPNQDLPNVLLICGVLTLYLFLLVPVNWAVLRLLKKMEWAWVTLPVTVLVFTAALYGVGALLRGSSVTLHQVAVTYSGPGATLAQVDQAVGLLSPERRDYTVRFPVGALALSGFGYGEVSGQMQQAEQFTAVQVRSDIAAINEFWVQGQAPALPIQADLTLQAIGGNVRLTGVITNASAQTLNEAVLLAPGARVDLGDFAPGETRGINQLLSTSMSVLSADNTVDDVLGGGYYYDDRETYRRYSLLRALVRPYRTDDSGRGTGLYLAGWTNTAPLAVTVTDAAFTTDNLTLHLIGLPYALAATDGVFIVPPNLLRARPFSGAAANNYASTAYNFEILPGNTYQMVFQPDIPLRFSRVVALDVYLDSGVNLVSRRMSSYLWNFATNTWQDMEPWRSGVNRIPNPADLVGPRGEVRVRLDNNDAFNLLITEISLTLTLEQ